MADIAVAQSQEKAFLSVAKTMAREGLGCFAAKFQLLIFVYELKEILQQAVHVNEVAVVVGILDAETSEQFVRG